MDDLLDRMTRARLPWTSPRLREWYDEARVTAQLRHYLETEAGRVGDATFGTEFRDAVDPVTSTDPLSWANRVLDVGAGGWAVTGIRYRSLDRARPFVDVVATDQDPTTDGLAAVADAVLPAYQAFGPHCLRVEAGDPDDLVATMAADSRFGPGSAVDQYVLAGRVSDLRGAPFEGDLVELRPGEPAAMARLAAAIYAQHPAGAALMATPEDESSLAECAAEDLLFEVVLDGVAVGVVAAVRDDAHGLSGFCVQEICLDPAVRGRGLAGHAMRGLLLRLHARDGDVLWGTIHPANSPSLRNALSVGREIVGGYVWVVPAGLSGMGDRS
jgi:L-amino acid N-acyltransferase YncA